MTDQDKIDKLYDVIAERNMQIVERNELIKEAFITCDEIIASAGYNRAPASVQMLAVRIRNFLRGKDET